MYKTKTLSAAVILALCAVHAGAATHVFPTKRILWADPTRSRWSTDVAIDGHPAVPTLVTVSNCLVGRSVLVEPYGTAIVRNLGAALCGGPIGLLNVGNGVGASLNVIARYRTDDATMTLTFPALEGDGIQSPNDELRAGPIANIPGADRTYVLLFNEGAKESEVTLCVRDSVNKVIAYEYLRIPARGSLFRVLSTEIGVGSLRLRGAPTFGYAIVGPADGAVAPRVIPFALVQR